LLPRVSPFLDRIIAAERERARDRHLREEQDRAFQNAARRDKERIETKMAEERAQLEAKRTAEEASRREAKEVLIARQKKIDRMEWRKWTRSSIIQPSSSSSVSTSGPLRIAIRLPTGNRLVHSFSQTATLTSLYAFVDSQFIPPQFNPADDPTWLPDQSGVGENALESHISNLGPAEEYWGFRIALAYPRMEIPWKQDTRLLDVTHLKGGGQVVVETIEGRRVPVQNGNTKEEDDGYHTEDSE
jgi:FAS-associated factor 2